jgi:single-strand DNA-binding protein
VATLSVAANRKRKNDDDVTTWFKVTVWGSQAEACNTYLSKGRQVLIEGELTPDPATGSPRLWQRNDDSWGASYELRAYTVRFLQGGREQEQQEQEPEQEELPF